MHDAHGKSTRVSLVENYAPLVKRIAYQLMIAPARQRG